MIIGLIAHDMYVAIKWCTQKILIAAENFLRPKLPRASSSISLDLQKYTTVQK